VEAHNGEAVSQRLAFDALPAEMQNDLIEFLKSLQVLPPGSKSLVVEKRGRAKQECAVRNGKARRSWQRLIRAWQKQKNLRICYKPKFRETTSDSVATLYYRRRRLVYSQRQGSVPVTRMGTNTFSKSLPSKCSCSMAIR
jgi:hypothetical protein